MWIAYETYKGFSISQGFNTREEAQARLAHVLAYGEQVERLELREGGCIADSWLHWEWKRGEGVTFERKAA